MNNKGRSHKILCVHDVIYIVKCSQRLWETLETDTHFIKVVDQHTKPVTCLPRANMVRKNLEKQAQSQ